MLAEEETKAKRLEDAQGIEIIHFAGIYIHSSTTTNMSLVPAFFVLIPFFGL